ncbi:DUF2064 domain-containing protein [Gordonia sp. CPCC 205515]|uniref:TIGR04282 family arsenosugar biosynthesis glycosyltransferase n=1 Tax=Gordonia sp. CPCC 205515 TaxID=3140791 RepID=UPI003AF3B382
MTRAILIIAKAPVAGLAKTRLAPRFGPRGAARLAAAALIDTVTAALRVPHTEVIVSYTGDLTGAERADELGSLLSRCVTIGQRGGGFGARLANAHSDAAAMGFDRVLQIGMDTPQITATNLDEALNRLDPDAPRCVLGDAADGGWWAFGTTGARGAAALATVPMSQPDTGRRTRAALRRSGLRVDDLATMTDVDLPGDVDDVARLCAPDSEFVRAVTALAPATTVLR